MKMAKLPSPMLASVTMCNDKISKWNSKINGIRWFGISYICILTHCNYSQPTLIKLDNENIGGHLTPLHWVRGSFKIIENGTIRKPGYGFLVTSYSNYNRILCHFRNKAR